VRAGRRWGGAGIISSSQRHSSRGALAASISAWKQRGSVVARWQGINNVIRLVRKKKTRRRWTVGQRRRSRPRLVSVNCLHEKHHPHTSPLFTILASFTGLSWKFFPGRKPSCGEVIVPCSSSPLALITLIMWQTSRHALINMPAHEQCNVNSCGGGGINYKRQHNVLEKGKRAGQKKNSGHQI